MIMNTSNLKNLSVSISTPNKEKKIPLFCKNIYSIMITVCILLVMTIGISSLHYINAYAAPSDQKVYDNSGLFTSKEVASLETAFHEYGEKGKVDIFLFTEKDLGGKSKTKYIEDFYDTAGVGYNQKFGDAVIMLINMDPDNRSFEIRGFGKAEQYVSSKRINRIIADIKPMLSDGKYYDASVEYAKQAAHYMNDKGLFFNTFFQLAISLLIGAIVVGIMAFRSGGSITVNNRTYLDEQNAGVVAKQDDYIRTTVTRVKKSTDNNNGGGGNSVSSGGHSSSGGSSSF